jgi:hypothetical protein
MATVNKDSANWRLFGGGGMLVGGLLWLIGVLVGAFAGGGQVALWLTAIGILLVGIAQFFVAFGQTGSNGAVGTSLAGKLALVAFGLGWVLYAASIIFGSFGVAFPSAMHYVIGVLVVLGGLFAAFLVYGRGVARGAARWVLFLPVLWGVLFVIAMLGWIALSGWWLAAVLAALFAITGLLYLLNRKDVG